MANTLKIKRGTAATIPQGQLAEPLFTTDTYDLYIGKGSGGNQRIQNYIASGTSSQFLKGDGTLDSTSYQPLITAGTTSQYYRGDKTFQTLDTSVVPENGPIYFTEPRVRATVLTGLNLSGGGTIAATDSILTAFGKVQNQISALVGGATYQGTWNANTNTPTLASGTGTKGYYYVVSVAGSTNLDGITDWKIGDWAIFNGTTWDKVDNTDAVSSVNGFTGAVNLGLDNISDVSAASPTNAQFLRFNGTNSLWENYTLTSGDIPSGSNNYIQNNATATAQNAKFYIGTGNRIDNSTNTDGIYLANSGIGNGYRVANSSTGSGIVIDNSSGGTGLLVGNTSTGSGIVVDNSTAATGYLFRGAKNAVNKILMDDSGNITAASYIKSGGTSSQFLKADGSVDSNTYLTTSSASSTYLPLAGGTLTGALNGTSASFTANVTTPAGFYIDANTYLYEGILRLTDLVGKKNILQLQASSSGHYITSLFLSGGSQQAIYISAKSTSGQNVIFNTDGSTTFSHALSGTSATFSGFVGVNGSPATAFPLEAYINSATAYTTSSRGNVLRVYNTNTGANIFAGIELGGAGSANDGLAGINATVTGNGSAALTFYTRDANTFSEKFRIASTGAATFSSSVTAGGRINSGNGGGGTASLNAQQLSGDDAALYALGVATAGSSKGIRILAGTNSSDYALNVASYANSPILYARGDGNVGIGSTTPQSLLSLGAGVNAQKLLLYDNNNNFKYGFGIQTDELRQFYPSNGFMTIGTISTTDGTTFSERMRITSGGRVGIGQTAPGVALSVAGQTESWQLALTNVTGTAGAVIGSPSADVLAFGNWAGTERMRITSGGNVLVGYNQATTSIIGRTFATNHATANRGAILFYGIDDGSTGGMYVYNVASSSSAYNSQYITFATHEGGVDAAERMRITSMGAVQVTKNLTANSPSAGNTGEGIIAGTSFKIDATGTSQSAKMYVVTKTLSDTYGSAFQIQFANSDDNKGFGYNINTSGGYETYVKDSGANWQRRMVIAQGGDVEIINNLTANSYVSKKGTQSTANATWTTVYTIPQTTAAQGIYYVYAHYLDGVDGMAFIQILADRTYRRSINGSNGATVSVRLDGNNIQVYQSYGVTLNIDWSILIQKLL